MIRTDGTFTIYRLQHNWQGKGIWTYSIENDELFNASSDCWQITGVSGTFDLEHAKKALGEVVSRLDKNRVFRLVKVTIKQETKVVWPIDYSGNKPPTNDK